MAPYLVGGQVLGEFTEIESGKDEKNRPKLQEALTLCKLTGARLIIATLERLSRDLEFLAKLQKASRQESGVKFLCADMPDANEVTIGLMAVLAQDERRRISTRVKRALAEAKKRGTKRDGTPFRTATGKLGPTPAGIAAIKANGTRGRKLAVASLKRKANVFAQDLAPMLAELQEAGIRTQAAIAQALNQREIRTPRGLVGHWTQAGAGRLLSRVKAVRRFSATKAEAHA